MWPSLIEYKKGINKQRKQVMNTKTTNIFGI